MMLEHLHGWRLIEPVTPSARASCNICISSTRRDKLIEAFGQECRQKKGFHQCRHESQNKMVSMVELCKSSKSWARPCHLPRWKASRRAVEASPPCCRGRPAPWSKPSRARGIIDSPLWVALSRPFVLPRLLCIPLHACQKH
ncbi:hypothetical protein BS78_03G134200 [Paspalum vaginatum]|nr:hypothetical protein BS78_03G134200 [Paspalum vaginatum]